MKRTKTKQIDHYQIRFDQEIFVDLFAGGGGASIGIEAAAGMPEDPPITLTENKVGQLSFF